MNEDKFRPYKVFLSGELVDLCVPHQDAITQDGWADWFNNISQIQATTHGIFPNSENDQIEYFNGLKNREQILLLICRKLDRAAVGVISLQEFDMISKQASFSIMVGAPEKLPLVGLAALEAVSMISEHGFKEVGLNRIYGGQSYPRLKGWNKLLEIIGYKVDGIHRKALIRGHHYSDMLHISCLYEDYKKILSVRSKIWPGLAEVKLILRRQPKKSYAELLQAASDKLMNDHFDYIYRHK